MLRAPRSSHRFLGPLVTSLSLLAPVSALAQEAATQPGTGTTAGEPAADEARTVEARARFSQGLALARAGNCRGALAELQASFDLVPRPNTLFNMAQCQQELFRYDLAVRDYERYLTIAPEDAEDRPAVETQLRSLRSLLGTIHITVEPPLPAGQHGEVWLDDRIVGEAPGDVLVPGGNHAIELRTPGFLPARREVQVTARQTVSVSIPLERAQQTIEQHVHETIEQTVEQNIHVSRQPLPPAVFWTGVVLTAGTAIGGAAAGINALLTHDQQARLNPLLPRDTSGIRDSALAADVLFITSGVFLTTTIICAFLTDWTDGAPLAEAPPPRALLVPTLVPQSDGSLSLGLDLSGAF